MRCWSLQTTKKVQCARNVRGQTLSKKQKAKESQKIIYKIESVINGKVYIGLTGNKLAVRERSHKYMLKKNMHPSKPLQNDYNLFGPDNFICCILEDGIPPDLGDHFERFYIERYMSDKSHSGYNSYSGGVSGFRTTESMRKTISEKMVGKKRSQEFGAAVSEGQKGKKKNPEHVKKRADAQRGRPCPKNMRPIIDESGFIWPSISIAARVLGLSRNNITRAIRKNLPIKTKIFTYLIPRGKMNENKQRRRKNKKLHTEPLSSTEKS